MSAEDPSRNNPDPVPSEQVTDLLRGIVRRGARDVARERPERVRYFGEFELIEEIARGGMGIVYRARQSTLGREVALKTILAGALADDQAVERFRTEARAVAGLRHPGIVPIHEIGQHEGRHYFAMELVRGPSLAELLREGPLAPRRAATYARAIAEAVQHAHENGVLHRDLKPSNVLIDADDRPRVTDFGLAKHLETDSLRTATGAVLGTPSYMSPEQASGRSAALGPASDVYSLGALLYELLTGRPPFLASTPLETLRLVQEQVPAAPRSLNAAIPEDLETICLKCLEKRPQRRYPSALELARDLERFLERTPIRARRASRLRHAWSWARRRPWVVAGALSVGLVAVLGLAWWLWVERAYLLHLLEDPGRERSPGARSARLDHLETYLAFLFVPSIWTLNLLLIDSERCRGLRERDWFFPACAVVSGLVILFDLHFLARWVEAAVWEGVQNRSSLLSVAGTLYLSSYGLLVALQGQEDRESGILLQLSEDQETDLIELLTSGSRRDFRERRDRALQLVREWTGAGRATAGRSVAAVVRKVRGAYPDCVPPRWSPAILAGEFVLIVVVLLALLG